MILRLLITYVGLGSMRLLAGYLVSPEDITSSYSIISKGQLIELRVASPSYNFLTAHRLYFRKINDPLPVSPRGSWSAIAEIIRIEVEPNDLSVRYPDIVNFIVDNYCDPGSHLLDDSYVKEYKRIDNHDAKLARLLEKHAAAPLLKLCEDRWSLSFRVVNELSKQIHIYTLSGCNIPFNIYESHVITSCIPKDLGIEPHVR